MIVCIEKYIFILIKGYQMFFEKLNPSCITHVITLLVDIIQQNI